MTISRTTARLCTAFVAIALLAVPAVPVETARAADAPRFVTTWNGAAANLCLFGDVDVSINWGDGTTQQVVGTRSLGAPAVGHAFVDDAASHRVIVAGTFDQLRCSNTLLLDGLVSVDEWGATGTTSLNSAFLYANDLTTVAEPPATVTDMSHMFEGSAFNQPIGAWDISNVTDLSYMFEDSSFNQPIDAWDTSNVSNLNGTFYGTPFNQPLGSWDTSNVTAMVVTFAESAFNRPIGGWDTGSVTTMAQMFRDSSFNQPIGSWDTGSVTSMQGMFQNAAFNQPIGGWDTGDVTTMSSMFRDAVFNQPIGEWDTSRVTTIGSMFERSAFNQPIGSWDTSNITGMFATFSEAAIFNRDLSTWCVPGLLKEPPAFDDGATSWTRPRPIWGTCGGTDVTGPDVDFTRVDYDAGLLLLRGYASDPSGVARVLCAIQDQATGKWLRRDRTWGAYERLPAQLAAPGAATTKWTLGRRVPPGRYTIKLIAFDTLGHVNPRPRPVRTDEFG